MEIATIKNYIRLKLFFEDYCGINYTSHIRHKMRGKDSAGNKIGFTTEEEKAIRKGWRVMKQQISASLKK